MRRAARRGDLGRRTRRARRATPGSASRSPTRGLKALGVPPHSLGQLRLGVPAGHGRARRRHSATSATAPRALGGAARHTRRPRRADGAGTRRSRGSRRPSTAPATAYRDLPGVSAIWRQDCHALPTETEPFGFRDGISHPAIEGSGIPGTNPLETPLKAGEFVLGYPDETRRHAADARSPTSSAATAPTSRSASSTSASPPSAATCKRQRHRPRGRGAAGGQDDGPLAQRRAAGALPAARRPRAGRRPAPQQRLPVRARRRRSGTRRRRGSHIRRAQSARRRGGRRRRGCTG